MKQPRCRSNLKRPWDLAARYLERLCAGTFLSPMSIGGSKPDDTKELAATIVRLCLVLRHGLKAHRDWTIPFTARMHDRRQISTCAGRQTYVSRQRASLSPHIAAIPASSV